MNNRPYLFDPRAFVTGGVEDKDVTEPLQMAYAIQDTIADSLEPIDDDDGFRELQEQVAIINGFTKEAEDLDDLIVSVDGRQLVSTAEYAAIESRFPGVLSTPVGGGLEHYDWVTGMIDIRAGVEAMKTLKTGLMLLGVAAVLRFLLKWIGQNFVTASPPDAADAANAPSLLTAALKGLDFDPLELFKEYKPKDGEKESDDDEEEDASEEKAADAKKDTKVVAKEKIAAVTGKVKEAAGDVASKVTVGKNANFSAGIRQMTYPGITQEEVNELFKDGTISYAKLLKYQPKAFTFVLKAPVLAATDGLKILERDAAFLKDPAALAALKEFLDDLSDVGTDLRAWQNSIREGGGLSRKGQPVTTRQPLPPINGEFAVLAQKKLGWALTQPQTEGNKVILQTIAQSSVQAQADLYQPVKGKDENAKLPDVSHLDDLTPYVKVLNELSAVLPKWQSLLKSKEKEFTDLTALVTKYNKEFSESETLSDEQKKAMAYMNGHINKAFGNFKSILVWLSTITKWNTVMCKRINSMVLGMQKLHMVVKGEPLPAPEKKADAKTTKDKDNEDDDE